MNNTSLNLLRFISFRQSLIVEAVFAFVVLYTCYGQAETRGFWVDAFHDGFYNSSQVSNLISGVRNAKCNAVFVEVRKRGDVYYDSQIEPKTAALDGKYDALADLLRQAHDTHAGPRVEVHAWLTVLPIGRAVGEATNHVFRLHPEWLDRNYRGEIFNGHDHFLDPGHPEAQQYLCHLIEELVAKYDVDGVNLDYIHYPGKLWGYNPISVARFNKQFNRKGQPSPDDPAWSQFRRDQVTALVRKAYLTVLAIKPRVKFSAATVTWPPAPAAENQWATTPAYSEVFQDWRGWMEEGIIDINLPMMYFPFERAQYREAFKTWDNFVKTHRYNRHVVISPAIYMNSISNVLQQIQIARRSGSDGKSPDGVCFYSYASYSNENVPIERLFSALTSKKGPFAKRAEPLEMPWKTKPATGHLKGFVRASATTNIIDGGRITVEGPAKGTLTTDGTGFYGSVDLLPGEYMITASFNGYASETKTCVVNKGKVTTLDFYLNGQ